MKISRFLTSDRGVIAGLLVFLALLVSVMWSQSVAEAKREAQEKTLHFAGIRNDYGHPGVPPPQAYEELPEKVWSVRSTYIPGQDSIDVDLRQGSVPVDAKLKVFANFIAKQPHDVADSRWLSRVSDGRYRVTGVKLPRGTWTMGLTGYRNSKIAFRLEQTLTVE